LCDNNNDSQYKIKYLIIRTSTRYDIKYLYKPNGTYQNFLFFYWNQYPTNEYLMYNLFYNIIYNHLIKNILLQ